MSRISVTVECPAVSYQGDIRMQSTVAGTGAPGTIDLINPSAVVLDADGYLFIVDKNKQSRRWLRS